MSIIKELYDLTMPEFETEEERQAFRPQVPYLDAFSEAYSTTFINKFLAAQSAYQEACKLTCFTRALRLGVHLMLELTALGPCAPDTRHNSSDGR